MRSRCDASIRVRYWILRSFTCSVFISDYVYDFCTLNNTTLRQHAKEKLCQDFICNSPKDYLGVKRMMRVERQIKALYFCIHTEKKKEFSILFSHYHHREFAFIIYTESKKFTLPVFISLGYIVYTSDSKTVMLKPSSSCSEFNKAFKEFEKIECFLLFLLFFLFPAFSLHN